MLPKCHCSGHSLCIVTYFSIYGHHNANYSNELKCQSLEVSITKIVSMVPVPMHRLWNTKTRAKKFAISRPHFECCFIRHSVFHFVWMDQTQKEYHSSSEKHIFSSFIDSFSVVTAYFSIAFFIS